MKFFLIVVLVFIAFHAGRWDAKHGYEYGERHGKAIRGFLIERGWINGKAE